jgi:hypothetical protein
MGGIVASEGKQLSREFLESEFQKPARSRLHLIPIATINELHKTYSGIVKEGKGYPPSSKDLRSDYYDPVHAFRHHFREVRDSEDYTKVVKYFADFSNFEGVRPLEGLKGKIEELSSPDFYKGITQAGRMRRQGGAPEAKLLEEIKAALIWNVFQHYKFPKKL